MQVEVSHEMLKAAVLHEFIKVAKNYEASKAAIQFGCKAKSKLWPQQTTIVFSRRKYLSKFHVMHASICSESDSQARDK